MIMRKYLKQGLVAMVFMGVANYSIAQSSTLNNGQTSGNWNPFAGLFNTKTNITQQKASQAAQNQGNQRLASPMNLYPRTNKLNSYFADLPMLSNSVPVGRSTFPTRNQLPGAAYLQGFGYRYGGQR